MSAPNILVSNGTCYTSAGQKLDGSFIPCGNDAFGHQTCCGAGDNCLADLSCFGYHGTGYGSMLTYMAGCTDPEYKDKSCPQKPFDQPWIALTLCDNSGGAWAPCSQKGNPSTLQPGAYCSCTDASKTTVQFKDATVLANTASLPKGTGQSISFDPGYTPSGSPTPNSQAGSTGQASNSASNSPSGSSAPASNSASKSGSPSNSGSNGGSSTTTPPPRTTSAVVSGSTVEVTVTPSPSVVPIPSQPGGTHSGLGTGAKVGIGVGAAVGALIILGAIAALFWVRRRRKRRPAELKVEHRTTYDTKPPIRSMSDPEDHAAAKLTKPTKPTTPKVPEADGQPVSEVAGRAAQPWAVGRSELEGSPVEPKPPKPVELPARTRTNIAENF